MGSVGIVARTRQLHCLQNYLGLGLDRGLLIVLPFSLLWQD